MINNSLVVLINPGHDDEVDESVARSFGAHSRDIPREDPPLSILNLGAFIRDNGYDVRILDTHIEPDYTKKLEDLVKQQPLVIGLSVILGKYTKNAITLTRMIKEIDKNVPLVWGGKLVHLAVDQILNELDVDYAVIGDGEFPLLHLLDALREKADVSGIPGIAFIKEGSTVSNENTTIVDDLDTVYNSEDFGWDLIREKINRRQDPYFINLYSSRGCKYNCSFCYLRDIENRKPGLRYRRRSAENVIREIKYLNREFGINVFTFGDDDFLYDLEKVLPVIDYIKESGFYIEQFWTHLNNIKPDIVDRLAGTCQTICYSVETASTRLQKILRKSIPISRVLAVNGQLRQAGINTVHNFLFGVPTETDEESKQNIDLLKKIKQVNPYARANCYILSPIPGTPVFEFGQEVAGKEIEWTLSDLSNFHFRYMDSAASKFRPYLTAADNEFYENATVLANELFAEINAPATQEQIARINASDRLKYVFGDLDEICYPPAKTKKYILNRVIVAMEQKSPLPRIESF